MTSIPEVNYAWPLYGAGLENLGLEGEPDLRTMEMPGDDEILIRHDAVSLCYTDVKEITFGDSHPRLIGRNLKENPIVPGHEASMTVLAVGKNRADRYKVGERYVIQPDVWYQGKSVPYSFGMDGAYRQYAIIGKEVLDGDAGSYLIPVPEGMCYAGAALTEPWACVEASYRMKYRTTLAAGGKLWIHASAKPRAGYMPGDLLTAENAPGKVMLTNVPDDLREKITAVCNKLSIEVAEISVEEAGKEDGFDDILLLDPDADDVGLAADLLGKGGILAVFCEDKISAAAMDLGRIHYDHIVMIGSAALNLKEAYGRDVRVELKKGGTAMILGGGGPMGRMHLQRAIESSGSPAVIVSTDADDARLKDLEATFGPLAEEKGVKLLCANPVSQPDVYKKVIDEVVAEGGFDDIEVMVTHLPAITDAFELLGKGGVMNVFAGLKRGTKADFDISGIYGQKGCRLIGNSGSGLDDQIAIVERYKAGEIETRRSVAAVGGFRQIPEGIKAMKESRYPGKIVIYPTIEDFPLTAITGLGAVLPDVFNALENGRVWTAEAERLFLKEAQV